MAAAGSNHHPRPPMSSMVTTFLGLGQRPLSASEALKRAAQAFNQEEVRRLIDEENADVDWELLSTILQQALAADSSAAALSEINEQILPTLTWLFREYSANVHVGDAKAAMDLLSFLASHYTRENAPLCIGILQKLLQERGFNFSEPISASYYRDITAIAPGHLLPGNLSPLAQIAAEIYTQMYAAWMIIRDLRGIDLNTLNPLIAHSNAIEFARLLASPPFNARLSPFELTWLRGLAIAPAFNTLISTVDSTTGTPTSFHTYRPPAPTFTLGTAATTPADPSTIPTALPYLQALNAQQAAPQEEIIFEAGAGNTRGAAS